MATAKLYYAEVLNPRKACAVARYLNSPVEFVHIDLAKGEQKTPEFLALNPNGKVPALEDGDTRLWEADAIMCHLARAAGSDLWPTDGRQTDVIRTLNASQPCCRGRMTIWAVGKLTPSVERCSADQPRPRVRMTPCSSVGSCCPGRPTLV